MPLVNRDAATPPRATCGYLMRGPGVPCGLPPGHDLPHRPGEPQFAAPPAPLASTPLVSRRQARRAELDAAYRDQLNLAADQPLPSALGSTGTRPKDKKPSTKATTAKRRQRRASRAEPPATSTTKSAAPRAAVPKAAESSTCSACGREVPVGSPIGQYLGRQAHRTCARQRQAQGKILRGTTFRGHQASTWRRGRGPGSVA